MSTISRSGVADLFGPLRTTSPCPFAATSRFPSSATPPVQDVLDETLKSVADRLTTLCEDFQSERLHGFALTIGMGPLAQDPLIVGSILLRLLVGLNKVDPDRSPCMQVEIEREGWQFEFHATRLFVAVFAPFYYPDNTRFLDQDDAIVILFQPEGSFEFCNADPTNTRVKQSVRAFFEARGRPYDGALIDQRTEAYLYLKPLRLGDPPLPWWIDPNPEALAALAR